MAQHLPMDVETTATGDVESRQAQVRRFARVVSLAMIVLCNAIVLVGLWASGINLDELVATPDVFNSKQDICLRRIHGRVISPDLCGIASRCPFRRLPGDRRGRSRAA
jgi:hypothetical protein